MRYGYEAAGFTRNAAYMWRADDREFAAEWDTAVEEGIDALERECHRRATEGTLKPVFHQGEQCGQIREYSDTLAIFLLKGRRPAVFRDRLQSEVNLKAEVTIEDVGSKLLAKLDALADRAEAESPDSEPDAG